MFIKSHIFFKEVTEPLIVYFPPDIDLESLQGITDFEELTTYDDANISEESLVECKIGLVSGDFIFGLLTEPDFIEINGHPKVMWCVEDDTREKFNLVAVDEALNKRAVAAYSLLISHPSPELRKAMIKEFLKRKAAYIAAVEALVQGMTKENTHD